MINYKKKYLNMKKLLILKMNNIMILVKLINSYNINYNQVRFNKINENLFKIKMKQLIKVKLVK